MQSVTAYDSYTDRLFLSNPADAPKLRSHLNNDQFLDTISAPSSNRGGKKKSATKRGELVEISDESDEEDIS